MSETLITSIANQALTRINESLLVSINDKDERAVRIKALFPQVAREVLELHNWNSATRREVITRKAGRAVGEYQIAFSLPEAWVRTTLLLATSEPTTGERQYGRPLTEYSIQGRDLLVGLNPSETADQIALAYVAYATEDIGKWSANLKNLMSLLLASRMAVGTAGGLKLQSALLGEYERQFNRTCRVDTSQEGEYIDRYSIDDPGFTIYNYSQLSPGASFGGIGYTTVG